MKRKIKQILCHHEWVYLKKPSMTSFLKCVKCSKTQQQKRIKVRDISPRTYCWCPNCENDLVRDSFILQENDVVIYKCSRCGCKSEWDFSMRAMLPMLMK